ncbi:MAG: DUF6763 family protein [Steroidobacteraceae bacterium]
MNPKPEVGDWYQRAGTGEIFQVVSVDESSASVQIQTFDGQLESVEAEDWEELPLTVAAAPEDWTGALEDVEPDDITEDDLPSDRAAGLDRVEDLRE